MGEQYRTTLYRTIYVTDIFLTNFAFLGSKNNLFGDTLKFKWFFLYFNVIFWKLFCFLTKFEFENYLSGIYF